MITRAPFIVTKDGAWLEDFAEPQVSVINFSGGKQSTAILWMYLLGDLELPGRVIVLNADPGMENQGSYSIVSELKNECEKRGVYFETVEGPNLYRDLLGLKESGATRLDLPGYYTKDSTGKKGKLLQRCTSHYKIAPMDRALRRYMAENKVPLKPAIVHKIIGFSSNEIHRIKPPQQKYTAFRYPLVELGFTDEKVTTYLRQKGLRVPPRSVCNACFANTPSYLLNLKKTSPYDYEQALSVDSVIRDLKQIGVREEVYVLSCLKPVEIAVSEIEHSRSEEDLSGYEECTSGYCFV